MISEILKRILFFSQTLNRKEDVVTAILATMCYYSKPLIPFLFHLSGRQQINWINNADDFFITTGKTLINDISDFSSKVLDTESLSFRPDMLISDKRFNDIGHEQNLILIESKINAELTFNQVFGYKYYKDTYSKNVLVILIADYISNEYKPMFHTTITWKQVVDKINEYKKLDTTNPLEKEVINILLNILLDIGLSYNDLFSIIPEFYEPADGIVSISEFIKFMRKKRGLSQVELAKEIGVGLRFIRELEQGKKETLRTDKVNQVLNFFGTRLGPIKTD